MQPAHAASSSTTGTGASDAQLPVGERALSGGYRLVDPHEVADQGLLTALASAGLLDTYLRRANLHQATAILRVVEPSADYERARGELVRAAARHSLVADRASVAKQEFREWIAAQPNPAADGPALALAERDRRVRYVAATHRPALEAARASTDTVNALIDELHMTRRQETLAGVDLQAVALDAYLLGQQAAAAKDGCDVRWTTFAAIGHSESRHGTLHNATVNAWGDPSRTLLGPLLDGGESTRAADSSEQNTGNGFAVVRDSDRGQFDGNARWDRAIGPMQFLPSTWMVWSADGNGDGWENPQNMYDAVAGAANLLCGLIEERGYDPHNYLLGYNGSGSYVRKVLADAAVFEELFLPVVAKAADSP